LGGGLGILLAFWGVRALRSQINWSEYAVWIAKDISIDGRVLLFTVVVSVAAAMLFGLAPAIEVTRRQKNGGLREGSRSATAGPERNRLQRVLVVAQLALSLFLLVGAGLFVEAFREIIHTSIGFNPQNLLTASVSLRGPEYLRPERQKEFFESIQQRVAALPGVQSAVLASDLPFSFPRQARFTVEGHPAAGKNEELTSGYFLVSPGYFSTTQIPILSGRELAESDTADGAPVAIVNEAFARRFLDGQTPTGRHVLIDGQPASVPNRWSEIVGVVGNVNEQLGQRTPRPEIYVPFAANPAGAMHIVARTTIPPASLSDSLRQAVWAVDPDQAVSELRTMDDVIADSAQGDDLMAELMGGFALLALLIAAVGVFGVVSYLVGQRTLEIGIRSALGAQPNQLLKLVIGNGMSLVALGAAIGFPASLALPKIVVAVFQDLNAHSGWVVAVALMILVLSGLAACYVPARRAMRIDPMLALRSE
jgi:putative ABC transport system permease protein